MPATPSPHIGQSQESRPVGYEEAVLSPLPATGAQHPTLRFPETIIEVPEADYYEMGSANNLCPPQQRADDWSSMAATVVDDPLWATDGSGFQNGHRLT